MLTLFNPRKKRGKKRKSSRRRRRTGLPSYYSPCSRGGRKHYFKAVRKCKTAKQRRAAALAAKRYPKYAASSESRYMSSGLFSNGRRRCRRVRRNTSWVPGYAINPGKVLGSVTQGFSMNSITGVLPMATGALANVYARKIVRGYLPAMLQGQLADAAIGVATAGLLAAGARMVKPNWSNGILIGGMVQVMSGLAASYLLPMGDYLTQAQAADARQLGGMNQGGWIPDYGHGPASDSWAGAMHPGATTDDQGLDAIAAGHTTDNAVANAISADGEGEMSAGMGDYLTQAQAADARMLG